MGFIPFRLVRHPAYSADLALWLGAALGTLNALLLVSWPLYALAVAVQASLEETVLAQEFGDAYLRYTERVGRFVPRPVA
jgi:protein-S-isoprenylcysteine O-methyltransferase Ste14